MDASARAPGPTTVVSITHDGGTLDQLGLATPLLREFGIRGTFFLRPDAAIRDVRGWRDASLDQELGHGPLLGVSHPDGSLPGWTLAGVREDISDSRRFFEEVLRLPSPAVAALPGPTTSCADGDYGFLYHAAFDHVRIEAIRLEEVENDLLDTWEREPPRHRVIAVGSFDQRPAVMVVKYHWLLHMLTRDPGRFQVLPFGEASTRLVPL